MSIVFRLEHIGLTDLTTTTHLGTNLGQVSLLIVFREKPRLLLITERDNKKKKKRKQASLPCDRSTCWDKTSLRDKANLLPFQSDELSVQKDEYLGNSEDIRQLDSDSCPCGRQDSCERQEFCSLGNLKHQTRTPVEKRNKIEQSKTTTKASQNKPGGE
jgi:hypothetical protein